MWNKILTFCLIFVISTIILPQAVFAGGTPLINANYNYTINGEKLYLVESFKEDNGEIKPVNRSYLTMESACNVLKNSNIPYFYSCSVKDADNKIIIKFFLNPNHASGLAEAFMDISVNFYNNNSKVDTNLFFNRKYFGGTTNSVDKTLTTNNKYNKKEVVSLITYKNKKLVPLRFLAESLFYEIEISDSSSTMKIKPYNSVVIFKGPGYQLSDCSDKELKSGWSTEYGWNELHTCKGKNGKRYYGY